MNRLLMVVGFFACASMSFASVLSWGPAGVDWPAGALSQNFTVDSTNISMAFTGDTNRLLTSHPMTVPPGGPLPDEDQSWGVSGLWWAANFLNQGESLTLTIGFNQLVSGVSFNIYDIDGVNPTWEQLVVSASANGNPVAPVITPGAHIILSGSTLSSDGTFDADPGVAPNTAAVTFAFSNMIDTLVLTYSSSLNSERGELLGDVTFVPEPATLALLGFGGYLLGRRK
jgi:hypothetical protein